MEVCSYVKFEYGLMTKKRIPYLLGNEDTKNKYYWISKE
jgi:hypothetical protein